MSDARAPAARRVVLAAPAGVLEGIVAALEGTPFEVVGAAGSAEDAIAVARATAPDLLLVEGSLPGGDLHVVETVTRDVAGCAAVLVGTVATAEAVVDAVRAGAVGFLPPSFNPLALPRVLDAVLAGQAAIPRDLVAALVAEVQRGRDLRRSRLEAAYQALTDREWTVLTLLDEGLGTSAMAGRLGVSPVTVRRHVSAVLHKLRVPDRRAAVALLDATRRGQRAGGSHAAGARP